MSSWLPESASTYSSTIDNMFYLILVFTGVAFVLTEGLLFLFVFLYRRRQGRRATYTHGNNTLEVIWTVVPAILLVVLAVASRTAWTEIKGSTPETDEIVTITASQFNWEIRYPGEDGRFDTPDDVITNNEMRIPIGLPVKIRLRSEDVIHSFFLPHFRLKQDAVPGLTIEIWVEATRTGDFEIACAELCGFGHYSMKGILTVMEQDEYRDWLDEAEAGVAAAQAEPDAVPEASRKPA
ncbi:MAG: cytochrome c oxidase subunit II [Acidobacteria bacterium]|nr:cytochrome c oxidase subunit II [Acidobacteriota bacterium]